MKNFTSSLLSGEWIRTDAARTCLLGAFIFLLFFDTGRSFYVNPQNWMADDGCYLQHLGNYIGIDSTHICGYEDNYYARGVALIWTIPGFLGKMWAHLVNQSVTDWVLPIIGLTSFLCFVGAIYFIIRILKIKQMPFKADSKWLPLFALFILLNTFSLHYSTARVLLPHAAEIMLCFASLFFLLEDRLIEASFFSVLLTVTRYNDAPIVLLLIGRMLDRREQVRNLPARYRLLIGAVALGILGAGTWIGFFAGYHYTTVLDLMDTFQWKSLREFLYSPMWGMLWTSPWWLGACVIGLLRFHKSSNLSRAATAWLWMEAALCVLWGGNGSVFAYRYLIGSFGAALVIWLEFIEANRARQPVALGFSALTWVNGLWVTLMTMLFGTLKSLDPHWDGVTCFVPPELTQEMAKNLFNPEAYQFSFFRQLPTLSLYLSHHPEKVPKGIYFFPMSQPAFKVTWIFTALCLIFILAYFLGRTRLSRGNGK